MAVVTLVPIKATSRADGKVRLNRIMQEEALAAKVCRTKITQLHVLILVPGLLGGLFGKHNNTGNQGGYQQGPPPQTVIYQQAPAQPQRSGGMGMGGMLAAGGAGLLGGMLIEDALDDSMCFLYPRFRLLNACCVDNDNDNYDDGGGDW